MATTILSGIGNAVNIFRVGFNILWCWNRELGNKLALSPTEPVN